MQALTETLLEAGCAGRVVSLSQLARLLDGTPQRRYNLVNRALRSGELLQLRRGQYLLSGKMHRQWLHPLPHPFVLSQSLQPSPSYVSFESALSFHGWIPESVPSTFSVTLAGRGLLVDHAVLGSFRFYPLALRTGYGLACVDHLSLEGQSALVAQPLRALLDIVCLRKMEMHQIESLLGSMRVDRELMREVGMQAQGDVWQSLKSVYSHRRMSLAIECVQKEAIS